MARLSAVVLVLVLSVVVSCVTAAGLLDLLWAFGDADEERQGPEDISTSTSTTTERACTCEGPGCMCCADFNFTYIDLGGPGCVQMTYISPAEGINVNISYGDSVLLSQSIKGANPDPACLELIGGLAQMCARFSDLAPTSDGLRWCLQLEPGVLGEAQVQLPLGCFRMGPGGMVPDPPSNGTAPVNATATEEDLNEDALIAAVNESAEQGISFLSNLLGLYTSGGASAANGTETKPQTTSSEEEEAQNSSDNNNNNTATNARSDNKS